jgi:hypothetical protein
VHSEDRGDQIALWQTEAFDDRPWAWADYRAAARRLGRWQGAYVCGARTLPEAPWLSSNWLNGWVRGPLTQIMEFLEATDGWRHPPLCDHFSRAEVSHLKHLWNQREERLDHLARLPRTFCHLDAYRANLFWQGQKLMLIDWAMVGTGALGEELAAFVGATLLLRHIPVAEARRLEKEALTGYVAGLRDSGWNGDAQDIAFALQLAMPLRYAFISLGSMLRAQVQPEFGRDWAQRAGLPLPTLLAQRAALVGYFLAHAGLSVGPGGSGVALPAPARVDPLPATATLPAGRPPVTKGPTTISSVVMRR